MMLFEAINVENTKRGIYSGNVYYSYAYSIWTWIIPI